ncbi:Hypothetical predicted protein [Paramuricea clavata]|uniref:Uncharacterized protein n=1 Tax=Paramuricea clavata TaxID=317549 RepID=A0A7D9EBX8_PARCT|nr:Hypothetical predicted protein [Paramuricea clavata]
MDTETDNPNNNYINNLMELEQGIHSSDIQTESMVYNYSDAQITKLLDTDDDICELQMDALSLTRRGSTNIYYTNNKLNTNENDSLTNNSTPQNLDNSQTHNDSDTGLQNLTQRTPPRNDRNQPNTNNLDEPNNNSDYKTDTDTDNKETPSSTYRLLSTIPRHLHTTFQTLNNLKEKQIKTKATLENLTTHKRDGTLPNNLNKTTDCHIILDEDLRKRWVQASRDAAYKQLDILLEQQKRKLTNIETKITHATKRIMDNITDVTKTTEILKRTDEIGQRFLARWMSKHGNQHYKPNKNIKRLKGKRQDNNNKQTDTTTAKNSSPIQTHTAQHITENIHTPIQTDMATYSTNFMTTFNRPHTRPRGPLTSTTVRSNFLYRPNTPTLPIPINPLLQPTRYPLIPTTTTTATRPTHPLLSNHIQQQITNFIQPIHILSYLQDKQRTNNNRK